jgi:hypothetical protein
MQGGILLRLYCRVLILVMSNKVNLYLVVPLVETKTSMRTVYSRTMRHVSDRGVSYTLPEISMAIENGRSNKPDQTETIQWKMSNDQPGKPNKTWNNPIDNGD